EVGDGAVSVAFEVVPAGALVGDAGAGHHQVAGPHVLSHRAAGAYANEGLSAQVHELLDHYGQAGATHARGLHADRYALVRSGVAVQVAVLGVAGGGVEELLGHQGGAVRVAGEQDDGGYLAGLGSDMELAHWVKDTSCSRMNSLTEGRNREVLECRRDE